MKKKVIYQVFTRLFGNKKTSNVPWGTKEQNGVGKFNDITDKALTEIKALGVTHIWYTGIHHHALIGNHSDINVTNDHPEVVKGRAGSPYAIKDYYQVNPDLAVDTCNRLKEFEELIARTHNHGLKVIIDIVPNHVARNYQGLNNPEKVKDLGAGDDTSVEYKRDNNFYYIPDAIFESPDYPDSFTKLIDKDCPPFIERPAKWTGDGSCQPKPSFDDWYETVKINYGIRPDGSKDFPLLPADFELKGIQEHFKFWQKQDLPDSWYKYRDIALFWLDKGIDGFRFDIAQLVPVEFWSFLNSSIKVQNPTTLLLAEIYERDMYREFIHLGKMDYLYDKVDLYDTLKAIIQKKQSTQAINQIQHDYKDIEHHLLHFLENHDEQRIASPEFAGDANLAKPAMLLSATISSAPTLVYFGQEVGEPGAENAGFGQPSRTSIFDYVGVPNHQRWMNGGQFDGGKLSKDEKALRQFYASVLNYSLSSKAMLGEYIDLYSEISTQLKIDRDKLFIFARMSKNSKAIIVTNFSANSGIKHEVKLSRAVVAQMKLPDGSYAFNEKIEGNRVLIINITEGEGTLTLDLPPLAAFAYEL